MLKNKNVVAVLWDFDGTIVDSMQQHFLVNQIMYTHIKPKVKKEAWPKALKSLEQYTQAEYAAKNWRELYEDHFGFSKKETDRAGNLWGDLFAENETSIKIFDGILKVIPEIKLPQGICSQNCSDHIKRMLKKYQLDHYIPFVIGYKEISFEKQKPHAEGFLSCMEKMQIKDPGILLYVGDHEADVIFAKNAEIALKEKKTFFQIFSIAACYGRVDTKHWNASPDFKAYHPDDILKFIEKLQ